MNTPILSDDSESPRCDRDELARFVAWLFENCVPEDCVVEVRVLNAAQHGTVAGWFDADHKAEMVEVAAHWSGKAAAVYFTLNPVKCDLLARSTNRAKSFIKHTTGDADIAYRKLFMLDFDPKRPAGISSSDAELAAAVEAAEACRDWLQTQGWPDPVFAESGNGAHLLYPMDLPNDADSTALVNAALAAVAAHFDTEAVSVDRKVGNAARICKLYGTLAMKGDSTAERPHRIAQLMELPEPAGIVTREQLDSLAASVGVPMCVPAQPVERLPFGLSKVAFDVEAWAERRNVRIVRTKEWNGGTLYELAKCPFKPGHDDGSPFIICHADGEITAGCHHNSCADKRWSDFRDVLEPGWREKGDSRPLELDTDPHRLANMFRESCCLQPESAFPTLARWQGSWWKWNGMRWAPGNAKFG